MTEQEHIETMEKRLDEKTVEIKELRAAICRSLPVAESERLLEEVERRTVARLLRDES